MRKLTIFTDAHIYRKHTADLVDLFLSSKDNVYCLGDLFETPEDMERYGGFLKRHDFVWIKGNHEYWLDDLPEEVDLGDILLTHGHKILVTWPIEKYFVMYTPRARKFGIYDKAMAFGRRFRGSLVEWTFGKIVLELSRFRRPKDKKLVIMGHLHNLYVGNNILVVPKFPYYATLRGDRITIRNFLHEI